MKTFLNSLLMGLMLLLGMSCSSNTPESVAKEFAECIYTADYENAKKLCTAESVDAVGLIQGISSKYVDEIKKSSPDVKVVSCEVDEEKETAKVKVEIKNAFDLNEKAVNPDAETETYKMKKVDGEWRVQVSVK